MKFGSETFSRVVKGAMSAYYGQLITIVFQVLSVPVFLSNWGAETYGRWLVLFSIPTLISTMELGFFSVAVNKIIFYKNGLESEKAKVISSTLISFFLICLIFLMLVYFVSKFISPTKSTYILLIGYAVTLLSFNFFTTLTRVDRKYHIGSFFSNTARMIEYISILVPVYLLYNIDTVLMILVFIRLIMLTIYFFYLKTHYDFIGFIKPTRFCFFSYVSYKDALNYALLSISFILNTQAFILIVGNKFGNSAIVIFSTLRTFFRFSNQFVTAVTNSSWQEYTYLINEKHKLTQLLNKIILFSLFSSFIIFMLYLEFGSYFLKIWIHDGISYSKEFYVVLLFSVIMFSLWQPIHVFLSAIDAFRFHARIYFFIQIALIFLVYFCASSLANVAYMISFSEVIMFIVISIHCNRILSK